MALPQKASDTTKAIPDVQMTASRSKAKTPYPASALSNFAPHVFKFDGILCASMEGFLQSLKLADMAERERVCRPCGAGGAEHCPQETADRAVAYTMLGWHSSKAMVQAGIAHVPVGWPLFAGMTVREHLLMGAYLRGGATVKVHRDLDLVLATFPRLGERIGRDPSTLSGGEQQICAIGRGLMSGPRLLMIDALSLGLAPKIVGELDETLRGINRLGMSILLVEQDVAIALELTTRGFVIDTGRIVAADKTSTLAAREARSSLPFDLPCVSQRTNP